MRRMMSGLAMISLVAAAPASAQFRESAPAAQSDYDGMNNGGGFLGGILGCSADGGKQGTAAIIGGLAGAVLGNRIAGRGSRTLGTLLGGAAGAAAGSAIGCKLQKNDRDKAERAARDALETGQSQSWSNAETGATGRFDIADTNPPADGTALAGLRFAEGVEPAGSFAKIGESFTTRAASNVRAGPSTTAPVRGTLPAGMGVWVPAQVTSQPWMLVAENGVALGYVSSGLLTRAGTVASDCKLVTQTVNVPGEAQQSENYQACKGADGAWTMTRV